MKGQRPRARAPQKCCFAPASAQALGLLREELDAAAVARFLRFCPGLSKSTIGELLGENEDFFLEVLEAFTDTFDFAGAVER